MTEPTPEPSAPQPPAHGPEPAHPAEDRLGRRRRRRRHRRRNRERVPLPSGAGSDNPQGGSIEDEYENTTTAISSEDVAEEVAPRTWTTAPPPGPTCAVSEGPFVRAVLKEDGSLEYNIVKTRQRIGAKYLMKEVFD